MRCASAKERLGDRNTKGNLLAVRIAKPGRIRMDCHDTARVIDRGEPCVHPLKNQGEYKIRPYTITVLKIYNLGDTMEASLH